MMRDARARSSSTSAWTSSSCSGGRRSGVRSPRGSSSSRVTSSSTARRPRRRRRRRRAGARRQDGSLGIGSMKGGVAMNHLLRSHAPISDAGWALLDEEARERLAPRSPRASSSTSRAPTAGTTPRPTSAAPRRSSRRRRGRVAATGAACCRWSRCGPRSSFRAAELATPTAAPTTSTSARSTGRAPDRDRRERRRVPRLGRREVGIAEASPHARRQLGDSADGYPRKVASAVERLLESGITGPYGLALGPTQYRRVVETAEHGGYPLLDHLRQDPRGPDRVGARRRGRGRAQPSRRRLLFDAARTSRSATTRTTARSSASTRGELQLPRRHARGGGGAEAVTGDCERPPWRFSLARDQSARLGLRWSRARRRARKGRVCWPKT